MINSAAIRNLFAAPFLIWAVLFIFFPVVAIAWYGLTDAQGAMTLANISLMTHWEYLKALELSIVLALISTVICLIVAYPLCLILTEKKRGKGSLLFLLFILPMWMNSLLTTMAWQTILEKNGILNQFLRLLSLPDVSLINTPAAIVIGMIYNFLPYMVLPLYVALSKINGNVIAAARDLGASSWQTFTKVILPLSLPGAISGITMVFIPSLTTFFISGLLGGNKILLIGNIVEQEFTMAYDWHLGSGLSLVLMVFIVINMAVTAYFDRSEGQVKK
ncbi:putrescine ABC transporter [Megasphaera elsdenii CAG:570]|jgi:spermidine/putrescine transport system permease protein|uniref:Putrescine ABC transporter n=1 Tax=Megasphaera elsdenii CAG:570 TaxID=1263087 RepID=R7MUZ4_MEGEL|nr:ABC transporter permease [Megasphaera elsdenii]CDF04999.1 putrescine ABC transporter [Megasphaera elsdenii CAG:570]MCI5658600.1 ABC transporter permease [Megasphaera elsdenii]MCI6300210.1 ABC transporter permease [Megasphaera elsdenii]MDD7071105.1 ABC transporter permease [Megasphaera elsdenii]MDY5104174.1 ABC transporter permease [Megasphaera elsdenii]